MRMCACSCHAAVVELSAGKNAEIKYSTVQNWYAGNEEGVGGIYNFVTKRGLCHGAHCQDQLDAGAGHVGCHELDPASVMSGFAAIDAVLEATPCMVHFAHCSGQLEHRIWHRSKCPGLSV